jgi:dTMP kinase
VIDVKGKFIVFEGTDSSGKKTQTNLLADRMKKEGMRVEKVHFPTYQDSPLGVIVSKYLRGDFGSKEQVTPEIGSIFYSLDRYQFKDDLRQKLESGTNIIADRYTASNIFQAAKLDGENRFKIWEWIKALDSRLPQPNETIILNVPAEISKNLFSKRERKNDMVGERDIHEEDTTYQEKVRQTYLDIAKREGWIIIDCFMEKNGVKSLMPPKEIHNEVYRKLRERNVF